MNPGKKDFTWKNSQNSSSRIDQVWLSSSHTWNLAEAYIDEDTNPTIATDHRPSICKIEAWQLELTE
jgi:exonuclease III